MRRNTPKPLQFKSVAEAMKALGLKDADLAHEIGCDRTWITKLRRGQKIVALARPLKIARRLNVPIENLSAPDAA
jgi:transcriptional regulator with XRE-family HTH domain